MDCKVVRSTAVVLLVLQILLGRAVVQGGWGAAFGSVFSKAAKNPGVKKAGEFTLETAAEIVNPPNLPTPAPGTGDTVPSQTGQQPEGLTADDLKLLADLVSNVRSDPNAETNTNTCNQELLSPSQPLDEELLLACTLYTCIANDQSGAAAEAVGKRCFLDLLAFIIKQKPDDYEPTLCNVRQSADCNFFNCVKKGDSSASVCYDTNYTTAQSGSGSSSSTGTTSSQTGTPPAVSQSPQTGAAAAVTQSPFFLTTSFGICLSLAFMPFV